MALAEQLAAAAPEMTVPLRRAANEAAALAWVTFYPLLVFPALFEEKIAAALRHAERQARIYATSRDLVAAALKDGNVSADPTAIVKHVTVTGLGTSALVDLAYTDEQALRAQQDMRHALSLGIVAVRVVGTANFIDVAPAHSVGAAALPEPDPHHAGSAE